VIFKDFKPAEAETVAVVDAVAPIFPEKDVAERVMVGAGFSSSFLHALNQIVADKSRPVSKSVREFLNFMLKKFMY
jgi:hypothetical protein